MVFGLIQTKKVSLQEKAVFLKQLHAMVTAGVPLVKALNMIAEQTQHKYFSNLIFDISRRLEEGESLSVAFGHYDEIFPKIYTQAIKAAETAGRLEEVLGELAIEQDEEAKFVTGLRNSLVYPIFIFISMIAVSIILIVVVIPRLENLFLENSQMLPKSTITLIAIANFFIKYWLAVIAVVFGFYYAMKFFVRSEQGRFFVDSVYLKTPWLNNILKTIYMARFSHTLSMLIKSGVPIINAIMIVSGVIGNEVYKKNLIYCAGQLERGIPLSVPISGSKIYPSIMGQMLVAGEQTGEMDGVLDSMSKYFKQDAEDKLKLVSNLVEPALIVVIGVAVALVVFSVMVPIYQIATLVK